MPSVLTIGAGPAGSLAAIVLSRAGWDVTLVEHHRFPRDKVCGETLSALGMSVLRRHGLAEAIEACRPTKITHASFWAADGTPLTVRLPSPMYGLSRMAMDLALLDQAKGCGVHILQPARCEHIEPGRRPVGRMRMLADNAIREFVVDHILLADGKGALGGSRPAATADLGLKAHFADINAPRCAVELFGVRRHYVGLGPIEDGHWNIAMSIPAERVRLAGGDFDALFEQITRENEMLVTRMKGARRLTPWLAAPLPRFAVGETWPEGVIPIGNAAAAIEPIGGEGMGLALRSAELAAEWLSQGRFDAHELRRQFRKLWRLRSAASRASAVILSSPRLSGPALTMTSRTPLPAMVLRLLGKGQAKADSTGS
jgi:flavin-dependent dehydrogenase